MIYATGTVSTYKGYPMADSSMTHQELREEIAVLKQKILDLEKSGLELKRADEEVKLYSQRLTVFSEIGLSLTSELNIDVLLNSIVQSALKLIGGASCNCYLYNPQMDLLERVVSAGTDLIPSKKTRQRGEGMVGQVWVRGTALLVNDYRSWSGRTRTYDSLPSRALVAAPFHYGTEFLGILNIMAPLPHQYTQADVEMLNLFATHAAIAIRNARLFDQMKRELLERRRAEEALRDSEERHRRIVEALNDAVLLRAKGMIIYANPAAVKLFRANDPEELIGKRYLDLVHPDDRAISAERIKKNIDENSTAYPREHRVLALDGQVVHVESTGWPIKYQGETQVFGVFRDITNRKRAEEEKAKLQGQLIQLQKMESVGRLAGGVAHDFNNMLGVILGHAEMALEQVDPAQPLHTNLEEIRRAANRSADLTRQLLAFARKQTVSPKVLDLNGTVDGMLKMLQRLIGEDIQLAWFPVSNVWPVKMDPSQVDQMLANLSVNARDAIAGVGKITIETQNVSFDEEYCAGHAGLVPGEYVLLAVSDDGCGMNKDILGKLFEPFFTTKEVGKGTGLGLAMVYGIVKQNNGFIDVYSEPGQGTTFKIYLPRYRGKTEQVRPEGAPAPESTMAGRETVLVVEDEPALLDLSRLMLEKQGYLVLAAGTPGEAIRLAGEHAGEIRLMLTDVVMPEMNGRDLARKMLSLHPNLKCLFMSGYTADVIAHRGILDDKAHFIQKPFSFKNLAARVREVLEGNS